MAAAPKIIAIYLTNSSNGAPLTGQSLEWALYKTSPDAVTWTDATGPDWAEVGGGWYVAVAAPVAGKAIVGTIDCGVSADVRYVPWQARADDYATDGIDDEIAAIKAQTDLLSTSPSEPGTISAMRLRIASSAVASVVDPLNVNLTSAALRALRMQPLIVGDDWAPRFLVLDGGVTVDLTDGAILSTLRLPNGTSVMTRSTGVVIEASSPSKLQIELDDQATDNGSGGTTGRGWFTMRFGHEAADAAALQSALTAVVPVVDFDVKVTIANATRTRLRGVIEIVKSIS